MKTKKTNLINLNIITILTLSLFLMVSSCKSKKPAVTIEDDIENKEEIVKADPNIAISKATLQKVIDNYDDYSIEDKEAIIAKIKALNLKDDKIDGMITTIETKITEEKEKIRKEKEEAAKPANRLVKYFKSIANATSTTDADYNIKQAMNMFKSPAATVLIIISEGDYGKDYDKPTNITKYLRKIKDTKTILDSVEEIKYENNKIKTLILRKKK